MSGPYNSLILSIQGDSVVLADLYQNNLICLSQLRDLKLNLFAQEFSLYLEKCFEEIVDGTFAKLAFIFTGQGFKILHEYSIDISDERDPNHW